MRLVSVCQKPAVDNFHETPHPMHCSEARIWDAACCAFASLAGRRPGSDANRRRAQRICTFRKPPQCTSYQIAKNNQLSADLWTSCPRFLFFKQLFSSLDRAKRQHSGS